MHIGYWWESQKERDHWEDQDVGGWTILKWILEIWYGMVSTEAGFPMHLDLDVVHCASAWNFKSAAIPSQLRRYAQPTCRRTVVPSYSSFLILR
jgi:hypothetical protein